jgi:hypothetical protein
MNVVTQIAAAEKSAAGRVADHDWDAIGAELNSYGCAVLPKLLTTGECRSIAALYPQEEHFRSHIHMARHGFGKGEYRYFKYPLPAPIGELRTALYARIVPFANAWNERMKIAVGYPAAHATAGDYNCLHQDLYGELAFPLQVAILLSAPGRDFTGGEFVLTERRPRMQSRVEVVPLAQGDGVLFAVHDRPVQGTKGVYRVDLRHGVSRVRSGERHTLGIIFHGAK